MKCFLTIMKGRGKYKISSVDTGSAKCRLINILIRCEINIGTIIRS